MPDQPQSGAVRVDRATVPPADADEIRLIHDEVEFAAAERLTFFSDAVVAIAITLLALELPVPHNGSTAEVLHEMSNHLMAYVAFFISFAVIGQHWAAHHAVFRWIRRLGGHAQRLNMLWLMILVLTPYITKLLTEGAGGGFIVRFGLYALAQAIAGVLFVLMIRNMRRYDLFRPGVPEDSINATLLSSAVMASVFAISIPVALVAGRWAYLVWIAMPVAWRIAGGIRQRRQGGHHHLHLEAPLCSRRSPDGRVLAPASLAPMLARAVPALVLAGITAACSSAAEGTGPAVHGPDPLAGVSARQIASQALAGLKHAGSVRISGTFTERPGTAHPWASGLVRNLASLITAKTACAGTDTVSGLASAEDASGSAPRPERGAYRFLRIGTRSWVKGDTAFYTHFWFMDDSMSVTAGSKYVYLDGGDDANIGRLCDASRWLTTGFTVPPGARPAKAGRVLFSGQAALKIRAAPDEYLYVSDTRTPRLLRATVPGTEDVTFTGYDVPVAAVKPAVQDTISETAVIAANR